MSWPLIKLTEVAEVNPRCPKDIDENQIVSFIAMASASEEGLLLGEDPKVLKDTKKGFTYFERGDVLLAKITPCFENGKTLRPYQIKNQVGFGSTEFHVVRANLERLDPTYLFYLLWSDAFRFLGTNAMAGAAGQKRVGTPFLKQLEIPLPPLEEQKRIATILDKADAIRQKRKQAIALVDELLRSVFLDMFGDPVTNTKGWKTKKMVDLCGVGSSKRVFISEFVETGIPFYRGTEVGKLAENKEITPSLFISEEHYQSLVQHSGIPQIGDLLLPSICHDGRIWKVIDDVPFYFKDGRVLWIKASSAQGIKSDYLKSFLQHVFYSNYDSIASGTTFSELKIIALKQLNVLVPPMDLQEKFALFLKKSSVLRENTKGSFKQTEASFQSLSQKTFSGQL